MNNQRINWNEPRFDQEDIDSVTEVLRNNYVNEGPKTKLLEEELQKYLGVKHVTMTANCTASLFMAIKADSIIKNIQDFEVIVPDMTMIASATAVGWAGGKVILADVDKETGLISIKDLKNKITNKTTAIIVVDILGRSPDYNEIKKIASEKNISIIEDAAGALGSKEGDKFLGTFGEVGCYSLQSNKIITCGQGGFVSTDDDKYHEIMRRIRDFGRFSNKESIHEKEGYNLKFSDLAAALVLSQLKKIDSRKKLLVEQRNIYERELSSVKQIHFAKIDISKGEIPLWIDVHIENRQALVDYLKTNNIFARDCWPAVHRNPPYSHLGSDKDFPNASYIADNCLWLPNGPHLSEKDIIGICERIKEFYK
ncbi:MAG: DegT/DnrJ/EryC1/StrS family aminotransferase [Nanoarchaeota archaeon]